MKSIVAEIESREVQICGICRENPIRENTITCSRECSIKYTGFYRKDYSKKYSRALMILKDKYKKEFWKIFKKVGANDESKTLD